MYNGYIFWLQPAPIIRPNLETLKEQIHKLHKLNINLILIYIYIYINCIYTHTSYTFKFGLMKATRCS